MRRTLLQLRLSPRSASTSSTRIYASFRSATFTASARSSSGRRSGRSDHPGAASSSSMATIAANDIKERRRLRFFLSPSSSFTSSTRERAFGNDRRQEQQQQQLRRKLYATNARADEDDEAQKKNRGGDEDDGKNNVTRRSVANVIVRPKSAVDVEQGEMRDKTVPIHASAHIIEEKESSFDEKIVLPGRHFDVPIRIDIAHRCVRWQLARKRGVSTAKTKSRGEVSGTTRKARPQKGGGRARVGSLRAPQMRGGRYRARADSERFRAQVAKESEKARVKGGAVGQGGGREISRRGGFEMDESNWENERGEVWVEAAVEV